MKLKPVLQLSSTECGIASLAMICAYFGLHVGLDELRKRCGTSRDGVRAAVLMKTAEALGLQACAYRVELEGIVKFNRPVIAYWRFNHFVVIKQVKRNKVYLNDPACGSRIVSLDEFDKCFTGIILVFEPALHFKRAPVLAKWYPMLCEWLSNRVHALVFVLFCALITLIIPLFNAQLYAVFVDFCLLKHQYSWLPSLVLLVLLSIMILMTAVKLLQASQFRLSIKAGLMQSAGMMQHLLKMPLLYFSLRQKPELTALVLRAEASAASLFKSMGAGFANLLAAIIAFIMMVKLDYQLALYLSGLLLLYAIPLNITSKLSAEYEQVNIITSGRYYGDLLTGIKCIETIKACGVENSVLSKWQAAMQDKINGLDLTRSLAILLQLFYQSYHSLSMIFTLAIGASRVTEGVMTLGGLMAFYSVQLFFTSQLFALQQVIKEWQAADAMQTRMNDLQQISVDTRFTKSVVHELDYQQTALSCESLSFHYNLSALPVLSDINLAIPSGSVVGFTGATGSGKSTLIKILAHLFKPDIGRILLYGQDCLHGSAALMPETIAYVSQETNLFSGTIYENLTLGMPQVSEEVIIAALRDACLVDLIKSRGLHGKVEEGGSNFSGGERQRLEIARALIQSTKILILDEATAALDAATEAAIMQHLRSRKLTILMIAHRLATLKNCDCIYVLDQGRIVEQGSHDNLLAQQSYYYQLVQSGRSELCA